MNNCVLKVECVLFVVRKEHGIESVTIYRPYFGPADKVFCQSHWGAVDICYSWRNTFLHMERKNSGLYTGIPLPGEEFKVLEYSEAYEEAEKLRKGI